jgi:hypothetical protein
VTVSPALMTLDGDRLSSPYRAPIIPQRRKTQHSLSTPTGCMTAMLGRRRASPTGCFILTRCWSGSALGDCAITRFVADAVAEDPALVAVLAEAFEMLPGALDPFAPRQSSQGCRTRCGARCDRKIGQPRRPDDNTAVNRARAFLDTAIESSVTAEDFDRETVSTASASLAASARKWVLRRIAISSAGVSFGFGLGSSAGLLLPRPPSPQASPISAI